MASTSSPRPSQPGRGRRIAAGTGRITAGTAVRLVRVTRSQFALRFILAMFVVFGAWNALNLGLADATIGPVWRTFRVFQDWMNGGPPMEARQAGPLLFSLLAWLGYGVAFIYVVNKAWQGFGPLGRFLTGAIVLVIVLLVYVYFGDTAMLHSAAAVLTLMQMAVFGVLLFGLNRAAVDRYLSGTTVTTQLDAGQHADSAFDDGATGHHHH